MSMTRSWRVGAVTLLACSVCGCRSSGLRPDVFARLSVADPVLLKHYEWHGISPGAGFIRTELHAVEIDFTSGLRRSVSATAQRPEPLIECPGVGTPSLLQDKRWTPMDPRDADAIVSAAHAWLATAPPVTCESVRSRGREDGYAVIFTLRTTEGTYRVRVNPPDRERPLVDCHPDHATCPAFAELVALAKRD